MLGTLLQTTQGGDGINTQSFKMAVKIATVLLLLFLGSCYGEGNRSCFYQYTQQPEKNLSCNPHGARLQLHCGATGPLVPPFHLEWYSSTYISQLDITTQGKISSEPSYSIHNYVVDVMDRAATSILVTETITHEHSGVCFWCQIELNGLALPAQSNKLCIQSDEYYKHILEADYCNDNPDYFGFIFVDTSVVCVNVSEDLAIELANLKDKTELTSTPVPAITSSSIQTIQTVHGGSTTMHNIVGSEAPYSASTNVNTALHSLHTVTPVATSTSKTQVPATPSSTLKEVFASSCASDSQNQPTMSSPTSTAGTMAAETVPRASFEGALYAAIIVCIMFVGVIVILIVVIVCLTRKKCLCLERAGVSLRQYFERMRTGRRSQSENNHVTNGAVIEQVNGSSAMLESGIGSTQVEFSSLDQSRTLNSDNGVRYSKQSELERSTHRAVSVDPPPPELPPKPKKSATLPRSYDHLEPVAVGVKDHSFSYSASVQVDTSARAENSNKKLSKFDNYYHTLEDSNDGSGLLRSATASHASSQAYNVGGSQNISNGMSSRLKELFDDPRYAMLKLDSYGDGHAVTGLTRRKDYSRSTPSIVTLLQPMQASGLTRGDMERRSLKLPRWISTNKSRDIYEN